MMDIKGKLSLLGSPLHPASEPNQRDVLGELRSRMQALLEPSTTTAQLEPRPAVAPENEFSELPFALEHGEAGVLWRRQERLAPHTHVGRIPLESARDACPHTLALLALDPRIGDVKPEGVLFLDTETTGLGGSGSLAFLIGLAWFDSGQLVLEQLLLRSPQDERATLQYLAGRLARSTLLVTYNGKTFDMPLLLSRFVMNRLPKPVSLPHLDLLHVARRLHKERLGQCRLVSLENAVLGFERGEDIPGLEIPPLYGHYLRTGDGGVLAPVVEHNAWDVMSMAALMGLYGEPIEALHHEDLVGLARTFQRAGALEQAQAVADRALRRGAGPRARFMSGLIAKARGDKNRALQDFEQLSQEVDDHRVRLELAKLYEHHVKEPLKALRVVALGTGERAESLEKRRERLVRKYSKLKEKTN